MILKPFKLNINQIIVVMNQRVLGRKKKKGSVFTNVSWAENHHIIISEESCDTEDQSNGYRNKLNTGINYMLR